MATKPLESVTLEVLSVSARGDRIVLGMQKGSVEVEKGSHPDLKKLKAPVKINVSLSSSNKTKLGKGETVDGKFEGVFVEPTPVAAPRSSDSRGS